MYFFFKRAFVPIIMKNIIRGLQVGTLGLVSDCVFSEFLTSGHRQGWASSWVYWFFCGHSGSCLVTGTGGCMGLSHLWSVLWGFCDYDTWKHIFTQKQEKYFHRDLFCHICHKFKHTNAKTCPPLFAHTNNWVFE